jgi:hypothetical protein
MFTFTLIILAVLVVAYVLANVKFKLSVELSMFVSAIIASIVGGIILPDVNRLELLLPLRHIAEGSATYIDLILIFFFATLFMNIIKESGGLTLMAQGILKVSRFRPLALLLVMVLMLIPGAITGAGSVSVLVAGSTAAMVLSKIGVSKDRITAMIFFLAGLAAVCPPVSIWAMLVCGGTGVPYVGFELPLLWPVLVCGLFVSLWLGLRKTADPNEAASLPKIPKGMNAWRLIVPFAVLIALFMAPRLVKFVIPTLGLPLVFLISGLVALLCAPKSARINVLKLAESTLSQLLPLMTTMIVVGVFIQILSVTGVRGLVSFAIIALPIQVMLISLIVVNPVTEGILGFGGAAVIGIPLIWTLSSRGYNQALPLVIAGLSLLWALGDGLPPTAIIFRMTKQTVNYEGTYKNFLKTSIVPWIFITVVAFVLIYFGGSIVNWPIWG